MSNIKSDDECESSNTASQKELRSISDNINLIYANLSATT